MTDADVLAYLLSHAPLEHFYIFMAPGDGGAMMKYFDERGRSWNLMEDDEKTAASAVSFLVRSGVPVFDDYASILQFEQGAYRGLK